MKHLKEKSSQIFTTISRRCAHGVIVVLSMDKLQRRT